MKCFHFCCDSWRIWHFIFDWYWSRMALLSPMDARCVHWTFSYVSYV